MNYKKMVMKKTAFSSLLLIAIMFVAASCSKSNSRPPSGSETNSFGWTFSNISITTVQSSLNVPGSTLKTADMLSAANKDKANYLTSAVLQYNTSNIAINGLPAGITIKDITIQASDKSITPLDLGAVTGTGSSITLSGNAALTFLNSVCNSLFKNKSITLNATVSTGDQTITGISIVVTCDATLSW